ncbi:two-component system sensor histidine kinase ChvG [Rhodobium orientis]|uniref:histidine kinase n=1 Tax=Rhodobium orientis TaxID=34017 RepID=A0A327JEV6_9HYPH|nr:sensor histidine kinase [Rhodobium orientis]MBB4303567.1 two-component system sensor histidine kinase ChvG [Rhodobium orientis]MBK5950496.1 histidine kinase [Rhodobium orientis]RAI24264.1 histidine kinase [Rhodobium orientis]
MAIDAETGAAAPEAPQEKRGLKRRLRLWRHISARIARGLGVHVFSNLTRRIVILNLFGLLALVSGILYLNQFRAGLIDARVESLLTQGEIIAGAIATSSTADSDTMTVDPERLLELQVGETITPAEDTLQALDFPINPEKIAPILRRLITPTKTRARIYDRDGILILDSRHLYSRGQVLRFDLPPASDGEAGWFGRFWQSLLFWIRSRELPAYQELTGADGRNYPEVDTALSGSPASIVRVNDKGEMIVSVAVPIQRFRAVLGSLLLSTQGGDIDAIVSAERMAIFRVFLVASIVMLVLSVLLASTIAAPLRRLAAAAKRVRRGVSARQQIPDFSDRQDEIGNLSQALRNMTNALYNRIDAIEQFAADVAHELKNPLTSLRSAVETLPLAKKPEARERLLQVIEHDVRRLDRLISDISDASRLDAELSRIDAEPFDMAELARAVVHMAGQVRHEGEPAVALIVNEPKPAMKGAFIVTGHDGRLAQVLNNLIDNAKSFSPKGGTVRVILSRKEEMVEIAVEDDGPGIRAETTDRIFERFYTDRPDTDAFGNNSGLGLSISKQIVEAYGGTIRARNRTTSDPATGETRIAGARMVVRLPA